MLYRLNWLGTRHSEHFVHFVDAWAVDFVLFVVAVSLGAVFLLNF